MIIFLFILIFYLVIVSLIYLVVRGTEQKFNGIEMIGEHVKDINWHLGPGQYGKAIDGTWWFCTPNGLRGRFNDKDVVKYEDDTITVKPAFLIENDSRQWNGYIERGVWIKC
jgi:hypothetical protein